MKNFVFENPNWIHATWLALVLTIVLIALQFMQSRRLDSFISRLMQSRLVSQTSLPRRIASATLLLLTLTSLIVALMRPQWGSTSVVSQRIESQTMICLDVSKSMLAEDTVPSRLERAKAEILALLDLMDETQQVGLLAFAGKATVLCPMTTDHGFLRLVLAETQPSSVGLGGTKIGDAILKAVDGFREAGDVNRMILLITDGEDHDSFPMDAARAAKEKGVRIVSVGFGDEAGSKIEYTDPRTGVRQYVKDSSGQEVISRLDGETLREIALETSGAYIPAGTGALDLRSIFETHFKSMLRGSFDEAELIIRNEVYQWFACLGLCLLFASLATKTLWRQHTYNSASNTLTGQTKSVLLLAGLALGSMPGNAAIGQDQATELKPSEERTADQNPEALTGSPRELYNRAVTLVATDPDEAERLLDKARSEADSDGELRYRSLYNLAWVEVVRADEQKDDPKAALQCLQLAANRFREAIRVRPASDEARRNLEIVSRRMLALNDQLSQSNPKEFDARLDQLIGSLREHQVELQRGVQLLESVTDIDAQREAYRRLGATQRQHIATAQKLVEDILQTLNSAKEQPADSQSSPEEQLQTAQLSNALPLLESCVQRMTKARSLGRRREGDRCFLRWSSALEDAKRARDQLRNPVELLQLLVSDAQMLRSLSASQLQRLELQPESDQRMSEAMMREYLFDSQSSLIQRVRQVEGLFAAIVQNAGDQPLSEGSQELDPQGAKLISRMQKSLPLINSSIEHFEFASTRLSESNLSAAIQSQTLGIDDLADAAEIFAELRQLIELMIALQSQITSQLQQVPLPEKVEAQQLKNISRSKVLEELLQEGLQAARQVQPEDVEQLAQGESSQEFDLSTFESALDALQSLKNELDQVVAAISPSETEDSSEEDGVSEQRLAAAIDSSSNAETKLMELRMMFATLIERLQAAASMQADINDAVVSIAGNEALQKPENLTQRAEEQDGLREKSVEIAKELEQQAQSVTAEGSTTAANTDSVAKSPEDSNEAQSENAAENYRKAVELVNEANAAMDTASAKLRMDSVDFQDTIEAQASALRKLLEALALLSDPNNQEGDQQNDSQDQSGEDQQEGKQEQNPGESPNQQSEQGESQSNADKQTEYAGNNEQLLQAIREREAARRNEKQKQAISSSGSLGKDW